MVAPITRLDAQLLTSFDHYALAVYPFIEGETQQQKGILPSDLQQLGTHIGKLHNHRTVSELLQPWVKTLRDELATYKKLQEKLQTKNTTQILTHCDINPGNVIFTHHNKIKTIDWEGIALSLPEQDVNMFSDSVHLPHFLPAYLEETGIDSPALTGGVLTSQASLVRCPLFPVLRHSV